MSFYRAEVSTQGQRLHRPGRTSSGAVLRHSATPHLGPKDVHTRGGGVRPKRALGSGGLHPGRAPSSAWGAAYHVSRAQVRVIAA